MFNFFLKSNRKGILSFCGAIVKVEFDIQQTEGKFTFRKFDNGDFRNGNPIISRHPNIVKAVIVGKKAWGLWSDQWSDGIVEGTFTPKEILDIFEDEGILIPSSLLTEFYKRIVKKFSKKHNTLFG